MVKRIGNLAEENRAEIYNTIMYCYGESDVHIPYKIILLISSRERVRLPVLETKPTVMFNSEKWKHDNYSSGSNE